MSVRIFIYRRVKHIFFMDKYQKYFCSAEVSSVIPGGGQNSPKVRGYTLNSALT